MVAMMAAGSADASLLNPDDLRFLETMARDVIEASRVAPGATVGATAPNSTGGTLIRPGGRDCYPAFWIRDYAMSLDCGIIPADEQRHALLLTADKQQDELWKCPSGSTVPPGSIADHISFGGKPIFFPGDLDDYEAQGGEQWGKLPCLDDPFYFVHMAAAYVRDTGDVAVLDREIRGKTLLKRLQEAFDMPPHRADNHLVHVELDNRGVNFGFFDTVTHTGDLLFASVLKYQAADELAALLKRASKPEAAAEYEAIAAAIQKALPTTFGLESGLLKASTGIGAQPDVWGTACAVYASALDPDAKRKACEALAKACANGTIAWQGMVRHVPTDADFSATSAWEKALAKLNTYQNGAYWGTGTGWVCYAIAQVDRTLAARLAQEYVAHLRAEDYRLGPEHGAPWECMHPTDNHRQNPVYMAGATCPLAAIQRLTAEAK
jgi:hypothetical protein